MKFSKIVLVIKENIDFRLIRELQNMYIPYTFSINISKAHTSVPNIFYLK